MDYTKIADQCCGIMSQTTTGESTMCNAKRDAKHVWTVAGIMAGAALAGAGTYLIWNSRQARMLRTAKRTGKILRRTGAILQAVADATD